MEPTNKAAGAKPSKVELAKLASQYLKTFVADELENGKSHFTEDATSILKFHGSYQQDDRDLRGPLKKEGKEHAYQFMVRVRVVGGSLSAEQYLACDHLAQTDRQRQPADHDAPGVSAPRRAQARPENDDPADQRKPALDPGRLRRRRAQRAVLPGPDPRRAARALQCRRLALGVALCAALEQLLGYLGRRREDRVAACRRKGRSVKTAADDPVEPLYGKTYLPRKFKTAFALPEDNCTDIHANDLGYLAIVKGGELEGYNVLVGGGLGTTPSAQKTFPFLAVPLCYVDRQ